MEKTYCQQCGTPLDEFGYCLNSHGDTLLPVSPTVSINCGACNSINNPKAVCCWNCGAELGVNARNTDVALGTESALKKALEAIKSHRRRDNYTMPENPNTPTLTHHQSDNKVHIALWGPKNAGKTVYLLALYLAAQQKNSEWSIGFDDATADLRTKFITDANSLRKGVWPAATVKDQMFIYKMLFYPSQQDKVEISVPPDDPFARIVDFFTKDPQANNKAKNNNFTGLSIEFADVAGERYLEEPIDSPLWEHLVGCNALICLLDPGDLEDQLILTSNLVENMFSKYRNKSAHQLIDGRYLPHYISVCFTKTDMDPWKPYLQGDNPEDLVDYLSDLHDLDLNKQFTLHFSPKRIRYHCISSVGYEYKKPGPDDKAARIRPVNVFRPLNDWLREKK